MNPQASPQAAEPMSPAPPARVGELSRIISFGAIGVVGLVVDTATLYAALALGTGPYAGRVVSYLAAATTTWALNRRFTFADHRDHNRLAELGRFLVANAFGGVLNYTTYALLIAGSPLVASIPFLGVAAGSLAGMSSNYLLSRRLVFRKRGAG